MQRILTQLSTTITEFKRNPNRVVRQAGDQPFAVIEKNKPVFYVMSVAAYDALLEQLWELEITPKVLENRKQLDQAITVNLNDL